MRLILDDCRNALDNLIDEGVEVDLVVTSPPYDNLRNYTGDFEWDFDVFKDIANKLYSILKWGG